MPAVKPIILAYKKTTIEREFRDFLKKYQPLGLIITQESCHNPQQLARFVEDFRDCVGREDAPVSIDQEGGRAQRLAGRILFDQGHLVLKSHPGSEHWPYYPAAAVLGQIYQASPELGVRAAYQCGWALGSVLAALGIDLDFAPVIDIPQPAADPIISDRAFATEPLAVIALAQQCARGLHEFGVKSCIKHVPGHGRATVDSHKALPVIDTPRSELEAWDFAPLAALAGSPWSMVAHVRMSQLDPVYPASQSRRIVEGLLRQDFGFLGVICTDCIWMEALEGSLSERARAAQRAGCDVIIAVHGSLAEQAAILDAVEPLSDASWERLAWANECVSQQRSAPALSEAQAHWRSEYEELKNLMREGGCELIAPPTVGRLEL